MPCYSPLKGFYSENGGWVRRLALARAPVEVLEVPCGQCIGCRLEKSRQWAIRIMHESQSWDSNSFLTLTYENLDHGPSLVPKHFTDFMKRLRKTGEKVRYYQCGEYGELNRRPHHHAAMFNYWPSDAKILTRTGEHTLYESEKLNDIWGHGQVSFGTLTFESAAYVARYVTKKVNGKLAREHYKHVDPKTGEIHQLHPEYATMSRRPGIGRDWVKRFGTDTYEKDEVIMRGRAMRPPRTYDINMETQNPELLEQVKEKREERALKKYGEKPEFHLWTYEDTDPETERRLHAGETIAKQRIQKRDTIR